jgi:penicillin-binding protein 2
MSTSRRIVTEAQQAFSFSRRSFFLGATQIGVGAVLAGRMAWLSIAQNEKYTLLSESNRVNLTLIPPRRGWIVDRAGRPLALNRTTFRVDLIPDRLADKAKVLAELQKLLAIDSQEMDRIKEELEQRASNPSLSPRIWTMSGLRQSAYAPRKCLASHRRRVLLAFTRKGQP